ncbi:MAG TPA: DUF4912 domain-containing protein [Pyrinomonadaceae bacterium]|jgi:hypothetical protein
MTTRKKEAPAGSSRAAANEAGGEALSRRLEGLDAASPARDVARLVAQSPRVLFFFWGFARDPREALRRALGAAGEPLQLAVRLVDLEGEEVATYAAAHDAQSIWFEARPRRAYRAEVGFFAPGSPFVRVLASNVVETAPDGPSEVSEDAADFHVSEPDFARILAASGFAGPAAAPARDGGPPNSPALARRAPSSFAHGAVAPGDDATAV